MDPWMNKEPTANGAPLLDNPRTNTALKFLSHTPHSPGTMFTNLPDEVLQQHILPLLHDKNPALQTSTALRTLTGSIIHTARLQPAKRTTNSHPAPTLRLFPALRTLLLPHNSSHAKATGLTALLATQPTLQATLHTLHMTGPAATSLLMLNNYSALTELHLRQTAVSDFSPLQTCNSLQVLLLPRARTPPDLQTIAACAQLHTLDLSHTLSPTTTFHHLSALHHVKLLDLTATNISSLTAIAGCTALQWLSVERTHVWDLSPLSTFAS